MSIPHPQSPPIDLPGGLSAIHLSRDSFCAPGSLVSSSSTTSEEAPSSIMSSAYSDSDSTQDQQQHHSSSLLGFSGAPSMSWPTQYDMNPQLTQNGNGFATPCPMSTQYMTGFEYSPGSNGLPFEANYNMAYSFSSDPTCPRSYGGLGMTNAMSNTSTESHPPAAYVIEAPKQLDGMEISDQGTSSQLLQYNSEYETQCMANVKVEGSGYESPYGSVPGTPCSTPHDDFQIASRNDDSAIDKEQPYAQLIYKALLDAPGHTMILRDIYNWFKENTDKAADKETKGWQNSIRHNLSMNGAFEKVEQPCEDSRKGFMWKLTDQAIREGVKSTTRYRSKQPNKRVNRSSNPLPQRQASGAKGGHASKRSARLRRSQRGHDFYGHRSDPYMCSRSVPDNHYEQPILDPHAVDLHDFPYGGPSSPYYGSDVDFHPGLGPIDELGPHPHGLLGSPFLEPVAMDHTGNMNTYSHPTSGSIPSHGLPGSYDGPFHNSTTYILPHDYATDDSMSTPSTPSPRTPETQGDCYMDMSTGYLLDDINSTYPE